MDLQLPTQANVQFQFWPIFGEKNPQSIKKFWDKRKNAYSNSEEFKYQEELIRIGKKKAKPKNYQFKLTQQNELSYYKKKTDNVPKGVIQLTDQFHLKLQQFNINKDQKILGIRIFKTEKITYSILSENPINIFTLWEYLSAVCVMNNFDDMYQPLNLLGKGSFATVYKVKKCVDDQIYAAKIYYKEALQTNQHKQKFVNMVKNECFVLRNVQHKNIIKIYEVFQQQDKVVLIMDYVQGPDLYQLIKRKKHLSEKNSALVMHQLISAIHALHTKECVHRDLKLENVLLESHESYSIKIVDFGFSEQINYLNLLSKAGTPGYIPPELFQSKPYTSKGDIFSLGVIFYSLVSGLSPFKGRTYRDIMEENKKAQISFAKPIWNNISEECKKLLLRMLDRNPDQRPSASEVLEENWFKKQIEDDNRYEMSQYLIQSVRNQFEDFQFNQQNNGVASFYQRSNYTIQKSVKWINPQKYKNENENFNDEFEKEIEQANEPGLENSSIQMIHKAKTTFCMNNRKSGGQ